MACLTFYTIGNESVPFQPQFLYHTNPLIVDCQWSEYGEWTACSETCGGGTRMSERVVVQNASYGGQECKGLAFKIDPCNKNPCPGKFLLP